MKRRFTLPRVLLPTLVLTALAAVAFLQAPAAADGKDVTFQNKSRFVQQLLVSYGADGECSEMPTSENIDLEPKSSQVVASGDSKVCWCGVAVKPDQERRNITRCGEWNVAKAGRKVRF